MAKSTQPKGGSAKIRFVMLEADISDGDLDQITQAIQNAFRPTTVVQYRPPAIERVALGTSSEPLAESDASIVESDETESGSVVKQNGGGGSRQAKPRRSKTPSVIEIDLKAEPAWVDFAKEHDPQTDFDRFLTVALWFKEARSTSAITADHAYTCYRAAGWSTGIPDFSKPLRNLRDRQFMTSGQNPGEFSINHLGIDRVLKLKEK